MRTSRSRHREHRRRSRPAAVVQDAPDDRRDDAARRDQHHDHDARSRGRPTTDSATTTATATAAPKKNEPRPRRRPSPGSAVDTRYGPVQVQITVKSGKITAATAVAVPVRATRAARRSTPTRSRRSNQEAVAAGSANIDMVSGATLHLRRLPPVAPERAEHGRPRMSVAPVEQPRTVHVEQLHGHGVHDRRPRPGRVGRTAIGEVVAWLHRVDAALQHLPRRTARSAGSGAASCASRTRIPPSPRCSGSALPSRGTPAATSRRAGTAASTRPGSSRAGRSSARAAFSAPGAAAITRSTAAATSSSPAGRGGSGSATRSTARSC